MNKYLLILLSFFLLINNVHAAKWAEVKGENIIVYDRPDSTSAATGNFQSGEKIKVSSRSKNGFHKTRLQNGRTGWISKDNVNFIRPPAELKNEAPPQTDEEYTQEPTDEELYQDEINKKKSYVDDDEDDEDPRWSKPTAFHPHEIRFLAGGTYFRLRDVLDYADLAPLKNTVYLESEYYYWFSPRFSLGIHFEYFTKKVATVSGSLDYDFKLSSFPVMLGPRLRLADGKYLHFDLAGQMGAAFNTTLTAESTSDTNELSASSFTAALKMILDLQLTPHFLLTSEVGYRYLNTGDLTPTTSGTSPIINQDTPLDLTGLFFGFGFAFRF